MWEFDTVEQYDSEIKPKLQHCLFMDMTQLYYSNDRTFNGKTTDTDGYDGLKSLEIIIAAYRSAKEETV